MVRRDSERAAPALEGGIAACFLRGRDVTDAVDRSASNSGPRRAAGNKGSEGCGANHGAKL